MKTPQTIFSVVIASLVLGCRLASGQSMPMPSSQPAVTQPSQQKPTARDPGLTVPTPMSDQEMDAQMKALGAQLKEMGSKMKAQSQAKQQPAAAPQQIKAMGSRMKDMGAMMQQRGQAMQMAKRPAPDAGTMSRMSPDMIMKMGDEMMGMVPTMEMGGPMVPAKMMKMGDEMMMGMMGMGAKPDAAPAASPAAVQPAPMQDM